MPSRDDTTRAKAQLRLRHETPVADDESLLPLQGEVDAIVREAKNRAPSPTGDVVSPVLDDIARAYFLYAHRQKSARSR